MKKVLITGGAGFIPSCLTDKLLSTGRYTIVAVDNFITGRREHLSTHPNYTLAHVVFGLNAIALIKVIPTDLLL